MSIYDPSLDFNFTEDEKRPPLVPDGFYHANVTAVSFDVENKVIIWDVTLDSNGGVCTDGETDIDGTVHQYKNWLPKAGDENERTASGKQTKRQSKINMMAEFMRKMKLPQATVSELLNAVEDAEFIGLEVEVELGAREYNGMVFNDVKQMYIPSE